MDAATAEASGSATAPAPPETPPRGRWWVDPLIALVILVAAAAFGTWYTLEWSGAPRGKYEFWIKPAVGMALGHGAHRPTEEILPGLEDFLEKKIDRIDAEPTGISTSPAHPIQRTHLYLAWIVSVFWRIFGLSWAAQAPLYGLLYGLTAAAAYGIFRLFIGRTLSIAGVVLFMLAPSQLAVLPHIRDYVKAPFILGVIFCCGLLLKYELGWRRLLPLAALLGLIIGVGLGMRQDVQICLVPAVAVLLLGLPGRPWRRLLIKLVAVALMLIVFTASAWPILQAMRAGGAYAAHNIVGGFARQPSLSLGVGNPNYEWVYLFNDNYIHQVIRGYAERSLNWEDPPRYLSPVYNEAGFAMIAETARVFPADFILRATASVKRVVEEAPLDFGEYDFSSNLFIDAMLVWQTPLLLFLADWGALIALIAVGVVMLHNLRLGISLFFITLFFCAYPSLQFHFRHYFHLGVFSWLFALFLLALVLRLFASVFRRTRRQAMRAALTDAAWWTGIGRNAVVYAALIVLTLVAPLWAARLYQQQSVGNWLAAREAALLQPLETELLESVGAGQPLYLLQPKELFPRDYTARESHWEQRGAYLVTEFETDQPRLPLGMSYEGVNTIANFSDYPPLNVQPDNGTVKTKYFFPVYEVPDGAAFGSQTSNARRFHGVTAPAGAIGAVKRLHRVRNYDDFPLLYNVLLPEDWRENVTRYATLQSRPLPRAIRSEGMRWRNALQYGDFEAWPADRAAPLGWQAPRAGSTLTRSGEHRFFGHTAVTQTWQESDVDVPVMQLFGTRVSGLLPNTPHDLYVEAMSRGVSPVVSVWQVDEADGQAAITPVAPQLVEIDADKLFLAPHLATFTTGPAAPGRSYLITVSSGGSSEGSVIWDNFRLAPTRLR